MSVFVTGTDTGVGKTTFTVWLLQFLRERGVRCAGYKPICCGDRDDAVRLHAASWTGLTIEEVNPIWLHTPAAPLTASQVEKRELDLTSLRSGFARLTGQVDLVAVEGVGGWMVPITSDYFSNHLAAELALPVIVIARNRLGCLNHVLLTVHAIEQAGLRCAGIVLNDFDVAADTATQTNAEILRSCLRAPVVAGFGCDRLADENALRQMLPSVDKILSSP